MKTEKLLLDTDIGGDIDDAVCLAYLLREPRCELLGVTTVSGEPESRAAVADAICQAAGRRVPIVAGTDQTLQPVPVYPRPEGAAALCRWPHAEYARGDAPGFLYEQIAAHPGEVVLVAIGSMTNVAELFLAHPDAPGMLKGLYAMNGYFGAQPLPEPWYNWNAWADPLATRIVMDSRVPVHRVFPLELTETLTLPAERAGALFAGKRFLLQALLDFGGAWLGSGGGLTLHDPLAAVAALYPDLCAYQRGDVSVETEDPERMGATTFAPNHEGRLQIARAVDRERFYRILFGTLGIRP